MYAIDRRNAKDLLSLLQHTFKIPFSPTGKSFIKEEMTTSRHYCIIDLETTGSAHQDHRITEIAVIRYDGKRVVDTFETLVNPERGIPRFLQSYIGITDSMVKEAPRFSDIAKKLVELTQDAVFVAHNVFFDFNFLKYEFGRLGYAFKSDKLCTVRLARRFLPGYRSYSLGKICQDLGIEVANRHRAMGDAKATLALFQRIQSEYPEPAALVSEFQTEQQIALPPKVNLEVYSRLPQTYGVYRLLDERGQLLYIGKSKNIKKRISTHFRLDCENQRDIQMKNSIADIAWEETGSDLAAKILECHYIKTLRPRFNRSMNHRGLTHQLKLDATAKFWDLKAEKVEGEALISSDQLYFKNLRAAKGKRASIIKKTFALPDDHKLAEKNLTGLKKTLGPDAFNERLQRHWEKQFYPQDDFALRLPGRTEDESAYVLVEGGALGGLVYAESENVVMRIPLAETPEMKHMLIAALRVHAPHAIPDFLSHV